MATLNAIQKSYLEEQRQRLEEGIQTSSTSIIKEASDNLFVLFKSSDNFADITLKEDLEMTQEKLEEGKEILAKQEINNDVCDGLGDTYTEMTEEIKLKKADQAENKDIDNIKRKIKSRMDGVKTIVTSAIDLKSIYASMAAGVSEKDIKKMALTFKVGIQDEKKIKDKIVVLLMELACVDNLVTLGYGKVSKNQMDKGNDMIQTINGKIDQLAAHQKICQTTELLATRIKNLEGLETTDPKNLPKHKLNKIIKTNISVDLKNKFIKTAKLGEIPKGYEISKPIIKDRDGNDIKLFQDITGTEFEEKALKTGESADIFMKSGDKYIKIGKIGTSKVAPTKLEIEITEYKDLPLELKIPITLEMQVSGIGGDALGLKNKVSISKKLLLSMEKPSFETEYDNLDKIIKQNERLEKMYNNLYETMLEDQLNKFFTNHPEESMRNGWAGLSDEQKKTFFIDLISNNSTPIRGAGIKNIQKVRKQNILSLKAFQDAFKESILKGFDGRTEVQLKEYILEKLGTEAFTKENPTYAQGLLGEEIMKKYNLDDEKKVLELAANKFFLGINDKSIVQAADSVLYPGTPDLRGTKDINAAVADVEAISEEQARNQANEEFAKSYQSSMKRSLGRARKFFFRTHIINNKVKKIMKGTSNGLLTDEETTSAVNRWMLKKDLKMAGANLIKVDTKVFNDPTFQERLNNITNEYLKNDGKWTKEAFAKEVTEMIENNHELKLYTEKNKVTQIGSNLIERVEFEKEQRVYYKEIFDITENFTNGTIKTRADYDKLIRAKLGEFANKQKRLPDMVKELGLDINANDFAEKLAAHKNVMEKMRNRTVNMRLNMMINAKPKQEPKGIFKKLVTGVQKDERGLTTAQHVNIDKLGGRGKLYRWIEKHPRWTALGTSIGLAGSAALLPTAISLTVGSGFLFVLNYLKKRGHYTKEHVKFEKELLSMTPEQRETYLKEMKDDAEKRPDRLRKVFPKKYDKYGASMEYLDKTQTLQQHVENIQRYTTSGDILSVAQKDSLREYVLKGIAALKLQEDKGRNFMSSAKGQEGIEKLYNELYNAVLGGIGRIDSSVKPIDAYNSIKGDIGKHTKTMLKSTDYETDRKKMTSMRTKLGLFAGGKAAAIYLGTARLVGQIRESRDHVFSSGGTEQHAASSTTTNRITSIQIDKAVQQQLQQDLGKTIDFSHISANDQRTIIDWFRNHGYSLNDATNEIYKITTIPGGVKLDDAFGTNGQDLLTKVFKGDTHNFELFKDKISALQTGDRTSTLWGTMKDIYGTNQLATEKTRAFFDNFGSSIMENNKHELITLTTQNPLSTTGADKIAEKMTSWYTNSGIITGDEYKIVTNPVKIKELFDGFANGTFDLKSLPQGRDLQTANDALHCKYGGFGDGLKEYIYDLGKTKTNEIIGKIGTETITNGGGGGGGGGGGAGGRNRLRFNSFGVPTFRNEVNNFGAKK